MYTIVENLARRLEEEGLPIFQNIVENSIDAILMTNAEFQIAYANHACNQLIGGNAIGQPLASIWSEADGALLDHIIELAQIGGFFSATRLNGFRQVIDQYPGIEIVGTLAADWDREQGRLAAEKFLRANPPGTLDIIWAASGEMALGVMMAVEAADRQGEVRIFSNDVTPESADRVREGRLIAETHHGFADWGWYGAKFAVMLALGLVVPPVFDIRPRTMYKKNADFFYPKPVLEPIDWEGMKADRALPEQIVIGWIQAAHTDVYQTATDYFEKAAAEARRHGINVKVVTRVLAGATDFVDQAAIIDDYIQRQVDVIALSTVKLDVVKQALNRAQAAGIPVIIVNQLEAIEGVEVSSYIGFDNTEAGTVSAYAVVDYLGGPGVLGQSEQIGLGPDTELDLAYWQNLYSDVDPEGINVQGRVAIIEGISGNWSGENRLVQSDGNLIDVDTITYPIRSKRGQLIGLVAAFRDATQRKQAERILIRQEQRIRSLYEITTRTISDETT